MSRILHLVLKEKWFKLIASGDKSEEYRDLKKHYADRLCSKICCDNINNRLYNIELRKEALVFKEFDVVCFQWGYRPDAPRVTLEFLGIEIATGKPEWGAEPGKEYFVIKLGKIIEP